jgi:hypothetical protein
MRILIRDLFIDIGFCVLHTVAISVIIICIAILIGV